MREEKALIERDYSKYPRKERKVSVPGVEALGAWFPGRAGLDGGLSEANYFCPDSSFLRRERSSRQEGQNPLALFANFINGFS